MLSLKKPVLVLNCPSDFKGVGSGGKGRGSFVVEALGSSIDLLSNPG
jgi:hypothetical protein